MKRLSYSFFILLFLYSLTAESQVIIENSDFKLTIENNGVASSLIHKATGEECLEVSKKIPAFSVTQYRPYDNEVMLAYPAKETTFAADSVYREGDELVISFELTDYVARVGLKITDKYIGFKLNKLEYHIAKFGVKRKTNIDEVTLLQLPIKNRGHFGSWLNVEWDNNVAVNLLGTGPFTKIDAEKRDGYKLMTAEAVAEVKLQEVGAALIVTGKDKLLDNIDQLEQDYDLPRGVKSRRSKEYKNSYYELRNVTPENIDEHIKYAKQGGFRQMVIYYPDFAASMGHFPWRDEYPNGMKDLQEVTGKIKAAGMIVGFHIHYNKAQINDSYVTPVPDPRLNLRRTFTLQANIDNQQDVIPVEENPAGCTLEDGRRILKIGNELVSYTNYTTTHPYKFTGCERGVLDTKPVERERGDLLGLLDVDTWPIFVRFNQKTNIQDEVAARLGEIYAKAGIQFIYFDGSEDAPRPYWFNIQYSKLKTYNAFKPAPIFSEGAVKTHFGWHIQSRGNAFDTFDPEYIKEAVRKHPAAEAAFLTNDFTSLNFGWIDYVAPEGDKIAMQPDMYEYITSKAAGWNCPVSFLGRLDQLKAHPRTTDNLEIMKRWEDIRETNFLTAKQKEDLKDLDKEFTLLKNEKGEFELVECKQITGIAGGDKNIRAFVFKLNNSVYVKYWHTTGGGALSIPVKKGKIELLDTPWKKANGLKRNKKMVEVPVDNIRFLKFNLPENSVIEFMNSAELTTFKR
jgi:hypothetical protein